MCPGLCTVSYTPSPFTAPAEELLLPLCLPQGPSSRSQTPVAQSLSRAAPAVPGRWVSPEGTRSRCSQVRVRPVPGEHGTVLLPGAPSWAGSGEEVWAGQGRPIKGTWNRGRSPAGEPGGVGMLQGHADGEQPALLQASPLERQTGTAASTMQTLMRTC